MAEWTRETPWRQGHLLTDDTVNFLELFHSDYSGETVVIVVSHDCDLAQLISNEPVVEVVVGRRITDIDGNYTHAKSARTLHIKFEGDVMLLAEFVITAKCSISKKMLADFKPAIEYRLSPSCKATLQRWLASRYRRSAFPDEFERRLLRETKLAERIAQAVKPHGELIAAVLFDVDEGQELVRTGADDVYVLDITLLHSVESNYDTAASAANTAKAAIQAAFKTKLFDEKSGKWQYIELRYFDVLSEETLTYRQFTLMKPWRLDYISLGADPQQRIVAE
jgi:hypothetical protein